MAMYEPKRDIFKCGKTAGSSTLASYYSKYGLPKVDVKTTKGTTIDKGQKK